MRRVIVAVAVVFVALLGAGVFVAARYLDGADQPPPPLISRACTVNTASGEVRLNADQMANAATIAAVGLVRQLPERAVVVALATALQESELKNIDYGDRDSVGLFQQRPSQGWGTPEQILDPRYSAGKFYASLVKVRNWEQLRVTEAAQRVQRSAFPEAYEKWADESTVLAEALTGRAASAVNCTQTGEPQQRGASAAVALGDGLRADWGANVPVQNQDALGLIVGVTDTDNQAGWRYAHWIVAHSIANGVERVRYLNHEWTSNGDGWRLVEGGPSNIVAEVFQL
jgi:hypothetical protein